MNERGSDPRESFLLHPQLIMYVVLAVGFCGYKVLLRQKAYVTYLFFYFFNEIG